jgi:hypothetical protein
MPEKKNKAAERAKAASKTENKIAKDSADELEDADLEKVAAGKSKKGSAGSGGGSTTPK